ncbi:rod-binding protein [Pseudoduganella sp. RAF53_2]|uniref:rod-binding protein n=1 Tax=unclassified Pseudoduganella TaxID=2637179 RepID=UPI003F9E6935
MDSSRINPLAQSLGTESELPNLQAPVAQPDEAYRAKATEAAVKFESFFIGQMLHKMRASARAVGDHDQQSESVNSDMLDLADNLVADQLSHRRAFGVADAILRQLLPAQPASAPPAVNSIAEKTVFSGKKTPPA